MWRSPVRIDRDLGGTYSYFLRYERIHSAGWSSLVARRAHNPKVIGSNPIPATKKTQVRGIESLTCFRVYPALGSSMVYEGVYDSENVLP